MATAPAISSETGTAIVTPVSRDASSPRASPTSRRLNNPFAGRAASKHDFSQSCTRRTVRIRQTAAGTTSTHPTVSAS